MKLFGYELKKSQPVQTKGYRTGIGNLLSDSGVKIDNNVFFDLYKRNPDIRQAINKISLAVARNGLYITNKKGDIVEIETLKQEIQDKFKDQTFLKFKKELFKQYLLTGELYITNNENIKGETVGFQILDSRTMSKIVDAEGNIISFRQYNKIGQVRNFTREEVAYYKLENDTNNEINGMGLLEGIVRDALADIKGAERNYYVIDNDSVPGGVLLLNDDMSQDEQSNAIDMFSRQHKGVSNANKMMAVGGVKDIKSLYINNKDMDRINQRKLTTEKVSSALGVPRTILGYSDGVNYSNAKEQKEEYTEGTIKPYEKDFEFIINTLLDKFAPKLGNKYDINADGETLEDREIIEKNQRDDLRLGIQTVDEIRNERGLDPFGTEQSQNPIISNNMIMLEDIIMNNGVNVGEI